MFLYILKYHNGIKIVTFLRIPQVDRNVFFMLPMLFSLQFLV